MSTATTPTTPTTEAERLRAKVQAFIDQRNADRDARGHATLTALRRSRYNPLTRRDDPPEGEA